MIFAVKHLSPYMLAEGTRIQDVYIYAQMHMPIGTYD